MVAGKCCFQFIFQLPLQLYGKMIAAVVNLLLNFQHGLTPLMASAPSSKALGEVCCA